MLRIIMISGLCFTAGNIVWPLFNEPKLFYVPLAVLLFSLLGFVKNKINKEPKWIRLVVNYLFILSCGNIVKQVFYTDKIKQINDYVFGGLVTIVFIFLFGQLWATQKQQSGRK